MSGDGYFASARPGAAWCPEDFSVIRGMAWKISGLGGADDDSEEISQEQALAILAEYGMEPDSIDQGRFPTPEERQQMDARRPTGT